MSRQIAVVRALTGRAFNEVLRVPGAVIPGLLAPTIFMLGLSSVFGAAANIPGFDTDSFRTFIVPVSLLQGAGFTGAATGVNLARDIESGWFDRLLMAPAPRSTLLAGLVSSAAIRALMPSTLLMVVGLALGVHWPGLLGLLVAIGLIMALASAVALFSIAVALRFRTQQAAPLMQMGNFIAVLFTASYAPHDLLQPWLRHVADFNPVSPILTGTRQGFIGDVTWGQTWPAYLSAAAIILALGANAVRSMRRVGR